MKENLFSDAVLLKLGPLPITQTMVSSACVSLTLFVALLVLARSVEHTPMSLPAAAARLLARFLSNLVEEAAGGPSTVLTAFAGALFLFIAGSAVLGQLPGVAAPTSNLAATSALAALVFVAVPIAGIQKQGLRRYLAHYLRPNPLLFPLHVISELSRTLALALRLFGNMMSGHLIVGLVVALVGLFVPVPLMALDLLIGLLQAYIFTILACVYVGAALRIGESV